MARAFPSVTGGASGLVLEPPIPFGRLGWYVLSVSALALGACSFAWLVRGRFLRTLRLVRHDELAAEVLGVNVVRLKAQVFTIGSAYSAVGGILLAYYVRVLAPESGGVNASLEALAMLVIGGSGSVFGPLIGTAAIQWLFAVSGGAGHYELLVYGVAFFFIILYAPAGIVGALRRGWAMGIGAARAIGRGRSLAIAHGPRPSGRTAAAAQARDAPRRLPRGRQCVQELRRPARGVGRELRSAFRPDRRVDRTQRRRQVHAIQRGVRDRDAVRRPRAAGRQRSRRRADLPTRRLYRPVISGAAARSRSDRRRQRRRAPRPYAGRPRRGYGAAHRTAASRCVRAFGIRRHAGEPHRARPS